MAGISDQIEMFIKALFQQSAGQVELQRNELAQYFRCAPSQINYVLSTRFTADQGYLIESRRGGGGFIRIVRLDMEKKSYLGETLQESIGEQITEDQARRVLECLKERAFITGREAQLILSGIADRVLENCAEKEKLRARILKTELLMLMKLEEE